jgi:hypothetical protein
MTRETRHWIVENKTCTHCAIDLMPMEVTRDPKLKASRCRNGQFAQPTYGTKQVDYS